VSTNYIDWHLVLTTLDDADEPDAWKLQDRDAICVRLAQAGGERLVITGQPELLAKFLCAAAARVLEVAATMAKPEPTTSIGDQP